MSSWIYTDTVKEHFMNPRNAIKDVESYKEDGKGMVGSMACGDEMLVLIQVQDGKISDCKWQTYGCASAIASTSMMSEMVIGWTLEQAYQLSPAQITEALGGLPDHKFHCSVLGDKALRAAIDDYLDRNSMENPYKAASAKILCDCKQVTDIQLEELVKSGVRDKKSLQEQTGYGTVCGRCVERVEHYIDELLHMF